MDADVEDGERLKKFTALLRRDQIEALKRFEHELERSKTFLIREAVDQWIARRQGRGIEA